MERERAVLRCVLIGLFLRISLGSAAAEDGYNLWLRYVEVPDAPLLSQYRSAATQIVVQGTSATMAAADSELTQALNGLLSRATPSQASVTADRAGETEP